MDFKILTAFIAFKVLGFKCLHQRGMIRNLNCFRTPTNPLTFPGDLIFSLTVVRKQFRMDPQVTTTASVRLVIQNLRSTDTIKKLKILKFLQHLLLLRYWDSQMFTLKGDDQEAQLFTLIYKSGGIPRRTDFSARMSSQNSLKWIHRQQQLSWFDI